MTNRKIQMPREVYIDPGIIKDTAKICKSLHLGDDFLIVTGSNTFNIGAKPVIESLEKDNLSYDVIKVDNASEESILEVEELILKANDSNGYPGLGYLKKLSIKNHLELILSLW